MEQGPDWLGNFMKPEADDKVICFGNKQHFCSGRGGLSNLQICACF